MRQLIKHILLAVRPSVIKKRLFQAYQSLSWKTLPNSEFDAELLILEFLLTPESIFFDVGANKGEYAYYAEKLMDPKHIYLFEPEKKLYHQLKAVFNACQVYCIALSDTKGEHLFKIPVINGVIDNCLSSLETSHTEANETEQIVYTVKTDTIDSFTKEHHIIPTLIKIDVEGHELSVIKGGADVIKTYNPTLIIEIEQRHHKNMDIQTVFNDFTALGYACYYYSKKQQQLLPYDMGVYLLNTPEYFGTPDYINNYIFVHHSNTKILPIDTINGAIALKTAHS